MLYEMYVLFLLPVCKLKKKRNRKNPTRRTNLNVEAGFDDRGFKKSYGKELVIYKFMF